MGNTKRCKKCKGTGIYPPFKMDSRTDCPDCEGTGIQLRTIVEEQFDEAGQIDGTKLYEGDAGFIAFEEEDYQP